MHDQIGSGAQHGIYWGSRLLPSVNVTISKNLLYNNNWTGVQFNGRVKYLYEDNNIVYGNFLTAFSWEEGVSNSFLRGNVAFNNGRGGLVISNYDGNDGAGHDCAVPDQGSICPYNQIENLIENNTFWQGQYDRSMDGSCSGNTICQPVILVGYQSGCTLATCRATNLGKQIFRNNVLVNYGQSTQYPPIVFPDNTKDFLSTSVFDHLVFQQLSGASSVIGFGFSNSFGYNPYTCDTAAAFTTISGCINADPMFVAASANYYNTPASFNLHLLASSPAIHTGTSSSVPNFDLTGMAFGSLSPSLGALSSTSSSMSCDINGDGSVNIIDVQLAINQTLGPATCGTADLNSDGVCSIIDVQRIIYASLGGPCILGP